MNKKEIIALLPDYVRGRLSSDENTRVAAMVAADPALARECEELRKYFSAVSSLPQEKAPTGFAARVMRRIENPEKKPSLAARIFLPLHIKLPLETAALLATAALLIVIYHPFQKMNAPSEKDRSVGDLALSEQAVQPALPSAPSPAADLRQEKSRPAVKAARSRHDDLKRDGIGPQERKNLAEAVPAEAKATEQSANMPDLASVPATARNAEAGRAMRVPEAEFAEEAPAQHAAAPVATSAPPAVAPAAAGAGYAADREPAAKPAVEAEEETPVQWELALADVDQPAKKMRRNYGVMKLKSADKEEAPASAETDELKLSSPIELTIRASGGMIARTEPDPAHAGATRYTITVPASSCDKLIAALSKHGTFVAPPRRPTGRKDARVTIVLLVR